MHQGKRQRVWVAPIKTQPAQPDREVVPEVVRSETLIDTGLQNQRHNLHDLDHRKTSERQATPTKPQGIEKATRSKTRSFDDLGCVGCTDDSKSDQGDISARTTFDTTGCVDMRVVSISPVKVGDKVYTSKGLGTVVEVDSDSYQISTPTYYGWLPITEIRKAEESIA